MKKQTLVIIFVLFALSIGLSLHTQYTGITNRSDSISEIHRSKNILQNGWQFRDTYDQNNTSIVITAFAPALSRLLHVDIEWVFRIVFPIIFALTPVLLFLFYRKILRSQWQAVLAVLFFILLPPSWQETPTIAKSMVAEPLAVMALIVWATNWTERYKIPVLTGLVLLTLVSHYTIGFLLIGWLVLLMVRQVKWQTFIPIVAGVSFSIVYFTIGAHGRVLYFLSHVNQFNPTDPHFFISLFFIWDKGTLYLNMLYEEYIVIFALIVLVGLSYLLTHRQALRNPLSILLIVVTLMVLAAYFIPPATYVLYLSRWIQINAIVLCPLLPLGLKWFTRTSPYINLF